MGFLDTHDAFVDARKNWSKYNLGVDFDTAWQEYYDKHYDPDNLEGWADPIWSEEAWNDLVRENGGDPDTVKEEYSDSLGESVLKSFDLEEEYRNTFKDEMDESLTEAMDFETWFNTEGWGQKTGQTFDEYVKDFPDAESLRHATPEEIRNNAYQFYDIWHVDSADRELAFEFASDKLGIPYDDLYNSWLDEVPINESMTDDADTQYTNGEIDYDEYLMLKTSELYNSSDKMRKRIDNWFEKNYPGAPEYKANIGELSGDELNRLLSDLGYKGFKTESLTEGAMTNGSYSLYNGWVKVPDKDSIPDEYPELEPEYTEWVEKANKCETIDDIDAFLDDVYKLRQQGLLSSGEYGKENLIFKELRNNGFLQELKDKKVKLQNKEMSLEGLNEGLSDKKFRDINGGLGLVDEIYTFQELKDIWDEDHNFDPSMEEYDSFEEWVNDTIMNYMKPVDESLN